MSEPIRIEADDAASAAALMQDAIGLFHAELVEADGEWEVLIRPDRPQERLVFDVLDFVERWLQASGMRSATVLLGGASDGIGSSAPAPLVTTERS